MISSESMGASFKLKRLFEENFWKSDTKYEYINFIIIFYFIIEIHIHILKIE